MSSRTDLCGGCRATGIPTAIPPGELPGPKDNLYRGSLSAPAAPSLTIL